MTCIINSPDSHNPLTHIAVTPVFTVEVVTGWKFQLLSGRAGIQTQITWPQAWANLEANLMLKRVSFIVGGLELKKEIFLGAPADTPSYFTF